MWSAGLMVFFLLILYECLVRPGITLRGLNLTVPRAVRAGHSVTLGCDYDLQEAPLYSVKWYRGLDEFYRYVPKEAPPTRVFPLPGLKVDVSVSNSRKVTLLSVDRPVSGTFQCEVSADAPLFHTFIQSAPMTVVEPPNGIPIVSVDRARFDQGGPLIADCTAPPSYPAANLTWFVNDQRVPGSTSDSVSIGADLLETATTRLELTGVGGSPTAVRLRCEAAVFRLYRADSLEVEVKPDSPRPASVLLMGQRDRNGPRLHLGLGVHRRRPSGDGDDSPGAHGGGGHRLYRADSLEFEVKPDSPRPASVLLMGQRDRNGFPSCNPSTSLLVLLSIASLTLSVQS